MMSSKNLMFNRSSRELLKNIRRHISKTSSAPNSDAISRQDHKLGVKNLDLNGSEQMSANEKWFVHSKHNNIRALSTIQTKAKPSVNNTPMFSKEESREFMAIFPDIVRDLTDAGRHTDIPEVTKRFAKVLQYNVPTGKKTRGLSTVIAYKMLERPENLTPENIRLANILGWCVELLRACGQVLDDMIDRSEIRHNELCWYKNDQIGFTAIADSNMMENSVYAILRKYFSDHSLYVPLLELFQDITIRSALGKSLEAEITHGNRHDLSKMTMTNFSLISKYRTGYFNLQLPVASAMYLAKMGDPEQHRQARTILLEMGHYFQVQKDFMNCFGKRGFTDKIGSDIEEGKCSWLAVVALQRVNSAQRQIMEKYYGKEGDEAIEAVKNMYVELGLPATYEKYEEQTYKIIHTHIQQISKGLPHKLFLTLLDQMYVLDQ
ncbi:farnesyl pyrophosphate synthase-like isoform X2 [Diabrotica undecimpunctata]|uniref:farnesyl pyrophosphate synthase-like isoform X2 n=1 Tax=Diabrotica undecimpunctata TaxID=50387 RepID=UPI003B63717A